MTPEWMKDLVLEARSPEEAAEIVEKLSADESRLSLLRSRTEESARMFDWDGIAQRHVELYDSLLRRDSRAKQPAAA
jgi:glycosyltransferase involved in cell wall biosynthesis